MKRWPLLLLLSACGGSDEPMTAPPAVKIFPEGFKSTYSALSMCQQSADHDLGYVITYASAEAAAARMQNNYPLPAGSVLVKEEYFDRNCAQFRSWSAMKKSTASDWTWQRVNADGTADTEAEKRCVGCHTVCGRDRDYLCLEI